MYEKYSRWNIIYAIKSQVIIMAKREFNRSAELETFLKVVECGNFSATARYFNNTPSSISKTISKLEQRLGARLFNRSTRNLTLTTEGCVFYEKGLQIITDLNEAERLVGQQQTPAGKITINCNIPFGKQYVLPLIPAFLAKYPDVSLQVELTDQIINLFEEKADIAIRSGKLSDSNLISKKLGATNMVVVCTPDYLKKHGSVQTPDDLNTHNLLDFSFSRSTNQWPFYIDNKEVVIVPKGNVKVSDGEALRTLVLSGLGIARLAYFQVQDDIRAGRLVSVMENYTRRNTEDIYAVYVGQGGILPNRIRAFLDFLYANVDVK